MEEIIPIDEANEPNEEELFEHHRVVVDKGQAPLRLDKFLQDRIKNASRNKLQNAIEAETVKVNDQTVKSNYKVKPDDVITLFLHHPPRDTEVYPENIPLDIVYEDDSFLIVNKAPNMVVHPAHGNWSGTLVNALVYHFNNLPTIQNGSGRPGLVHRIDKDTSGLLVISKTDFAMTFLAKQFFEHTIERTYYALIWGIPKEMNGTIKTYLSRSPTDRKVMAVTKNEETGKLAVTHYKVLETFKNFSLIQCNLETGRTHQIRVHMKHLGHSIFGDETYGGTSISRGQSIGSYKDFIEKTFRIMPRQALHAKSLGFVHPETRKWVQFDSVLPKDFTDVLDKIRNYFAESVV